LRSDLTWQEEAQAIARLHELRKSQHIDWSFADTANELQGDDESPATGGQRTKVTESIILADHLDDPLVAAAKTKKDAIKAVKEKNKHKLRMEAVEDFDSFLNGSLNDPTESLHSLILGNYFDEIEHIPDASYEIILTDPPYGIDIHRKGTFDIDVHEYDDSKDYFDEIINSLASQTFRVATQKAHCYVFCDIRRWSDIETAFFAAGWDCWPRPLIWHKGNIGSFANSDIGPRSTYECIFYGIKGHKQVQHNDMDVICINQSTRSDHPANKPVELYSNLLARSAFPGDKVIDFFCGSGPIFPAATSHKLVATGIELNPKYHAMAHERLVETMK
jgi:site-specific DNA-methyltransferase (adenine-specific)